MRRLLLVLTLTSLLFVMAAAVARADYWPPDLPSPQSMQPQLQHATH